MEREIDSAARALRKARDRVQFAHERLSALEERHRYVLLQFNPARAEVAVSVALKELSKNEPAARLKKPADEVSNVSSPKDASA